MSALIFKNGITGTDFLVFNPLDVEYTSEKPFFFKIELIQNKFWLDIKSKAWSSNCKFFFVVNKTGIVIGNVNDDDAFLSNLSSDVFQEFFNAFKKNINHDTRTIVDAKV